MSQTVMRIEMIVSDYIQETQKRPVAIALGPKEYLALCQFMQDQMPKDARVNNGLIQEAYGIPILLKEMPGIDLIIPHVFAHSYAGK